MDHVYVLVDEVAYEGQQFRAAYASLEAAQAGAVADHSFGWTWGEWKADGEDEWVREHPPGLVDTQRIYRAEVQA